MSSKRRGIERRVVDRRHRDQNRLRRPRRGRVESERGGDGVLLRRNGLGPAVEHRHREQRIAGRHERVGGRIGHDQRGQRRLGRVVRARHVLLPGIARPVRPRRERGPRLQASPRTDSSPRGPRRRAPRRRWRATCGRGDCGPRPHCRRAASLRAARRSCAAAPADVEAICDCCMRREERQAAARRDEIADRAREPIGGQRGRCGERGIRHFVETARERLARPCAACPCGEPRHPALADPAWVRCRSVAR